MSAIRKNRIKQTRGILSEVTGTIENITITRKGIIRVKNEKRRK